MNIEIYDNFDGTSTLTGLLGSISNQTCPYTGYQSFALTTPISISNGNDYFVKIHYQTTGYNYPIPIETTIGGYNAPTFETGKCWTKSTAGTIWNSTDGSNFDLCIYAYSMIPPSAPTVGTITQPTCVLATGSVVLNGLPANGWTLTQNPVGKTTTGTGTSKTISGLDAGTYTYTVTDVSGCISGASGSVVINAQPATPSAPTVGTITQPTCVLATGSVVLSGLPASGTWTINPGNITGTGTSTTISGLATGTYPYTVTNASGCVSAASANMVINVQPGTPTAPAVGAITQPTCVLATGSVVLTDLPASGTWTINPGNISGTGASTTISGLAIGTYTYTLTNASGCISAASGNVVINAQPEKPATPIITLNGNTLHSNFTNGNQWYNQNGLINSAINQDYTATSNGSYHAIVTVSGCSSEVSNIVNFVISGIELAKNNKTINVYPNPTTGIIEISIPEPFDSAYKIELFNLIGLVQTYAKQKNEKTTQIDLSVYPSGIYFIRVSTKGESYQSEIIKK